MKVDGLIKDRGLRAHNEAIRTQTTILHGGLCRRILQPVLRLRQRAFAWQSLWYSFSRFQHGQDDTSVSDFTSKTNRRPFRQAVSWRRWRA